MNKMFKGKNVIYSNMMFCAIYTIILIIFWFASYSSKISRSKEMVDDKISLNEQTLQYKQKLDTIKKKFNEKQELVKEKLGTYHSDQEIENLYSEISQIAINKGLSMKKIVRGNLEELELEFEKESKIIDTIAIKKRFKQFKVGMDYEMSGTYKNYMAFRKEIANLKKTIIFEQEVIERIDNGSIYATASLAVPKITYQENEQLTENLEK